MVTCGWSWHGKTWHFFVGANSACNTRYQQGFRSNGTVNASNKHPLLWPWMMVDNFQKMKMCKKCNQMYFELTGHFNEFINGEDEEQIMRKVVQSW